MPPATAVPSLFVLAVVATVVTVSPAGLLAQCAQGCLDCSPCSPSQVQSCSLPEQHGRAASSASLDMPHGSMAAQVQPAPWIGWSSSGITDEFVLGGAPPGVPVQLQARLRVRTAGPIQGINAASIHYYASLGEGASPPVELNRYPRDSNDFPAQTSFDSTLTVSVTVLPSQPFEIRAFVGVGTGPSAEVSVRGDLDFAGLPPEASLTSCGGYRQGAPVPARPKSWGVIKTRYR